MPAAGSRPDQTGRPQERVQRHTVEQLADCVRVVPLLDVLVPQTVDQLIEVPKISQDSILQRTLFSEP